MSSRLIDKLVLNKSNKGKGFSISEGIKIATGDLLIIQDADLEYNPQDIKNLLIPVIEHGADVVYGSRFRGGNAGRVLYYWHSVGNYILTLFSNNDAHKSIKIVRNVDSLILKLKNGACSNEIPYDIVGRRRYPF